MGNETIGDAIERREHVEEGALFAWVAPYVEATAPDTPPIIMAVWLLTNPSRPREQREADAWKVLKSSPDWSVIGPELVEALNDVLSIVAEIHREWDADNDVRVGKLLIALSGNLPKYRADIDAIHVLLSRAQALKERVG